MKTVNCLATSVLLALTGTASGQCIEPPACPPSSITSFGGWGGPNCCVADTNTTRLCNKYTTSYQAVDCQFTGIVSALASTASVATYSASGVCDNANGMDSTSDADAGPVADLDSGQSTSAVACSSASTNGVSASQYASMSISPTAINAVASSRVTNINRSYYDNCACEEAGFGGGIGGGFASVNSSGAIGLDCDPGGTIIVTRDPDVSAVITNFKAFRSFDCGPRRPGPTKPIYAEISRSTLNEHDAKGNIIASHTETVFHVEYDDNTNTVFDTLAPQPTDETPSRLLIIDPSTSSLTFESTIHIAGAPVTWSTWATFTQSVGAVWDEPSYNIEADINMNGVIEISDGAAILQQQGIMDLDQNGAVDAADHNAFLTLLTTQSASADINMDGMVDALDLHEWVVMLRSSRVSAAATASN